METTYWMKFMSNDNRSTFEKWESEYPITKQECDIYAKKKENQNNKMFILEEGCKDLY